MKYLFLITALCVTSLSYGQKRLISYDAKLLNQRISNPDTVYVVNFWATWCVPCVQELPEFDKLQETFAGKPVKVLLVSMDFKEDVAFRVPTFIDRKQMKPEVVWFSETNANKFIPKIENKWTGSIPATLVVAPKTKSRTFMERTISAEEIEKLVQAQL